MPPLGALVLVLAVAADGAGVVRVSASGRGLAVVAQGAALSAVLEEIGRQSGTSVTYEGTPPVARVTCDFVAATASEAFLRALEGLGLNYVLYGGSLDVPAIVLVSRPSGAAGTSATTALTTAGIAPGPAPAGSAPGLAPTFEPPAETDPPDEESPALATPPSDGAVPRRFGRRGQEEAASNGGETGGRPSEEALDKASPPPRGQGQSVPGAGKLMRDANGNGGRRNKPN